MAIGVSATSLADEGGRAIIAESQARTDVGSQRYEGLLQTFDGRGRKTEKRWIYERLGSHGSSRVTIRFTAPAEVKGVALLIIDHPDRASDQWMWTPAIERDRRIALQDRSTRFFGTDFSFEDLEERDVDQYNYERLDDQPIDGVPCWQIQSVAKQAKSSQYSKQIVWVRKDTFAIAQIDSYVKDQVARRLKYSNFSRVQDIWTAGELAMSDLKRGSITRLVLEKVAYNLPLSEDSFTLQGLRR